MLKVTEIDAYYGSIQALREITLEIGKKEIVCLIGANGAGKTTLLNVISCVLRPDKGKIEFLGKDITQFRPEMIVDAGIIQIPEGRELFNALTVKENLEMGAYIKIREGVKKGNLKRPRYNIRYVLSFKRPSWSVGGDFVRRRTTNAGHWSWSYGASKTIADG